MAEAYGFKRWPHDYKVGDLVLWSFYDMQKVCRVRNVGPNYITLENIQKPTDFMRVYEAEIDATIRRL